MFVSELEAADLFASVMEAEDVSFRLDACREDGSPNAYVIKDVHRIGAELNSSADFAKAFRLFEDFDFKARNQKTGRSRKTTNSTARDKHFGFHGYSQALHDEPALEHEGLKE
jgi:hypothetical protein